ncbi:Mor transcription activator family protein [Megalodesulfovibrio paquesii]
MHGEPCCPSSENGMWNPEQLDWSALPHGLAELKALVGATAAVLLAEAYGGDTVYVPSRARPDHPLATCAGLAAAETLARVHGGEKLHIPKPDAIERQVRAGRLRQLRNQGMSVAGLARAFHLTPRRVRQILAH